MKKIILLFTLFLAACGGGSSSSPSQSFTPKSTPPIPKVTITGQVYSDSGNMDCDVIEYKGQSYKCKSPFSINIEEPNYSKITFKKDGFIPTSVVIKNERNLNIKMYPETTVNQRSGFTKGTVFLDLANTYPVSFWEKIIADPKDNNSNIVSYVDVGFNSSCDLTNHSVNVSSVNPLYPDWRMSTEAELKLMVDKVHAEGMQFNLWMGVVNIEGCYNLYEVPASDTQFWDDWFSDYKQIMVERAGIAKRLGIEWMTLGHNMEYVTRLSKSKWEEITTAMRAVYPEVKLAYFGGVNITEDPSYFESDYYNEGNPAGFAELFDAIGHCVMSLSPVHDPTISDLKDGFSLLHEQTKDLNVPIWVLIMTPSTSEGTYDSTFMEPELLTDTIAENYTKNYTRQADVYEALFEFINATPTGNGEFMGVLTWGYHLRDNYRDTGPESNSNPNVNNLIVDKTANIRGKPADSILSWWFNKI